MFDYASSVMAKECTTYPPIVVLIVQMAEKGLIGLRYDPQTRITSVVNTHPTSTLSATEKSLLAKLFGAEMDASERRLARHTLFQIADELQKETEQSLYSDGYLKPGPLLPKILFGLMAIPAAVFAWWVMKDTSGQPSGFAVLGILVLIFGCVGAAINLERGWRLTPKGQAAIQPAPPYSATDTYDQLSEALSPHNKIEYWTGYSKPQAPTWLNLQWDDAATNVTLMKAVINQIALAFTPPREPNIWR